MYLIAYIYDILILPKFSGDIVISRPLLGGHQMIPRWKEEFNASIFSQVTAISVSAVDAGAGNYVWLNSIVFFETSYECL